MRSTIKPQSSVATVYGSSIVIVILALLVPNPCRAQTQAEWWVAPGAVVSATTTSGGPFQPVVNAGAEVEAGMLFNLAPSLALVSGIGIQWLPTSFSYNETVVLSINDDPVPATIQHVRSLQLLRAYVAPSLRVDFGTVDASLGVRLGYESASTYTDRQQFVDLPGIDFDDDDVTSESYPIRGVDRLHVAATAALGIKTVTTPYVNVQPAIVVSVGITSPNAALLQQQYAVGLQIRLSKPYPQVSESVQSLEDSVVPTAFIAPPATTPIVLDPEAMFTSIATQVLVRGTVVDSLRLAYTRIHHTARIAIADTCAQQPIQLGHRRRASDVMPDLLQHVADECIVPWTQPARERIATWTEEIWPECTLQMTPGYFSEEPVRGWTIAIETMSGIVLDSLGGDGAPPPSITYSIPETVLNQAETQGGFRCAFVLTTNSGETSLPVFSNVHLAPTTTHDQQKTWTIQRDNGGDLRLVPQE